MQPVRRSEAVGAGHDQHRAGVADLYELGHVTIVAIVAMVAIVASAAMEPERILRPGAAPAHA